MVEFVSSPQSQSSTHDNEEHTNKILMALDDSLYILHTIDSRILDVGFRGMRIGWNLIYFRGLLSNVSTVSLSLPFPALGPGMAFQNCVIPREAQGIIPWADGKSFLQFIAFEFGSHLTRIESSAFSQISELRSICLPRSVATICDCAFSKCDALMLLSFERGSIVTRIQLGLFPGSKSLCLLSLPA
jgi:hypothetical protein